MLCSLQQVESVKCAMLKCFDSVEVAYAYDKTAEVLPAGEALLTLWLERSISCVSNLTSLLILGKRWMVYLLLCFFMRWSWLSSSFECSCGWSLGTEWKVHDMEEHVNGKDHNVFIYDRNHEEPTDSMATSLKQHIIETLSFDGKNSPGYYRNRFAKGPSCNYCETGQLSRSND